MLASTASGLPGGSPTPVQLNIPQDAPEVAVAKANIRSNLANATVKAASDKLYRTQQTYFTNIEYLHKANESLADSTEKLGLVRDEIAKLDTEKVTLVCQKLRQSLGIVWDQCFTNGELPQETVRKVLFDCLSYIVALKEQIRQLRSFFDMLEVFVKSCVETQVDTFDETVALAGKKVKGHLSVSKNLVSV